MRALKTLVTALGVVILLLFGLLIWGLLRLGGERTEGPLEVEVKVPAGCSLAEARMEEDRILLRLEGLPGRDCQQVLLLDPQSGRLLRRLRLSSE